MKPLTITIIVLVVILAVYHTTHAPRPQGGFDRKAYSEWIDREVGRPAYNKWKLTQALNEFEQEMIRRGE